jgi:hypothetical protein
MIGKRFVSGDAFEASRCDARFENRLQPLLRRSQRLKPFGAGDVSGIAEAMP